MALCVAIHAAGLTAVLERVRTWQWTPARYWHTTWLFARVAGWAILLHLAEIAVWGVFYLATGAFEDASSAFYFSAVTYTTTGYGDLVLPQAWRLVGGIEALTGILMCGWSTGFFFAVVSRFHQQRVEITRA
jgi:ion channel